MAKARKLWKPTGFRAPLILAAVLAASGTATLSIIPQMDFRGENIVVDPTVVGPNCTMTIPIVGTVPQIAGGVGTTGLPGTIFSPAQAGAMDFTMDIANQGNQFQTTVVNTNTTLGLNFAALVFGREVEEASDQQKAQQATTGTAPAGTFLG
jgi:hypothetical protein